MVACNARGLATAGALYAYIRLINATARYSTHGAQHIEQAQASRRPVVWALWHGLNLAFVMWALAHHRHHHAAPIAVVGDRRALHLGLLARAFGVSTTQISAGRQGSARNFGLREMLRDLGPGQETFICPDGPAGPAGEPKRGAYLLARRSNALILPFGVWTPQGAEMRRWDNNLLPFPFARMTAVVGEPLDANEVGSERDFQARLKDRLTAVREEAFSLSRARIIAAPVSPQGLMPFHAPHRDAREGAC